jgi:putative ABC transport system permease protein
MRSHVRSTTSNGDERLGGRRWDARSRTRTGGAAAHERADLARDSLTGTFMNNWRLALRSLSRTPGFTVAAVLVLAIGVGGSTAVFSVLRGVVLRQLPVPSPGELVRFYELPAGIDAHWAFP